MISENSFSAAYPLADKINSAGKVARPLSGTPLETLVNAKPHTIFSSDLETGTDEPQQPLTEACDTEEHKEALSLTVDLSAGGLQQALYTAKNVVNPLIKEMVEKYETYVTNAVVDNTTVVSVQPVFYHSIWNNPVILSMTEKYDGVPMLRIPLTVKFQSASTDELRQLILTGSDRFDKELLDYIDKLNNEYQKDVLQYVYQTIFSFESMEGISELDKLINPFNGMADASVIVFLLASKLFTNIPEGITLSLAEYQAYVSGLVEQSGRAICRAIQKHETEEKNKTLIVNYPSAPFGSPYSNGRIQVNGVVYNQWLNDGGSPEVLFGAYASDTERGYTALLAGKDQYIQTWNREKKVLEAKVRFDMKTIKTTAIRKAFYDILSSLPDEMKTTTTTEANKSVERMLEHVDMHRLENIYYLVRKLICRSLFRNSPSEDILNAIDDVMTANPGMDEREAALLATIDYVGTWAASQIQCDSK